MPPAKPNPLRRMRPSRNLRNRLDFGFCGGGWGGGADGGGALVVSEGVGVFGGSASVWRVVVGGIDVGGAV